MADQVTAADAAGKIAAGEKPATVLGLSDTKVQALAALGYNVYQQGKLNEAETLFRGVAALDDKSYFGFAGLGAVALARKPVDLDEAYTNLSKAAQLNPNDATVQANLGEVLLRQGKVAEARQYLEKAFALDPGHNDPGANRARAIVGGLTAIVKETEKRVREESVAKAS